MPDINENESNPVQPEATKVAATDAKKPARSKKAGVQRKAAPRAKKAAKAEKPAMPEAVSSPAKRSRKVYSQDERSKALGEIEKLVASAKSSLKDAVRKVGISEQTYYSWKKAGAHTPQGDGLKDLVKLEEENARLKKLLAERLRKEDAELRRKLGL